MQQQQQQQIHENKYLINNICIFATQLISREHGILCILGADSVFQSNN